MNQRSFAFSCRTRVYVQALTHQHLLRSLDALMNHQEAVGYVVANLLRPLVDQDLSLVHGLQPPV